ncbi:MAG: PAS domain S-box protein [Nitrospirae bacterium]|nr:PAS domain S-box protein [Nitrospirota bacterium]
MMRKPVWGNTMKDPDQTLLEIQNANDEWRSTFDAMKEAVALLDAEGRIMRCNSAMAVLTQKSFSEIIGHACKELCICLGGHREACPTVICRETLKRESSVLRSGDLWFEVSADPIVDKAGQLQGTVHILKDITEHKQFENALRKSEEKFRYFFESANDSLFIVDMNGTLMDVNRTAYERLGYCREEMLGKSVTKFDTPEFAAQVPQRMALITESGKAVFESAHIAKDGRVIPVEINAIVIDYAGQKMVLSVIRDITERKSVEDIVKQQKLFTESLLQNSAVATFVLNAEHRVLIWNRACEELTMIPAAEMVGTMKQWKPFYDHARPVLADIVLEGLPADLAPLYSSVSQSLHAPDGLHAEGWYHLNGDDCYLVFDAAPIRDGRGAIIAAIETLQDITDHKRSEEAIRESEERYRSVVENAFDMIHSITPDGRFIYANPAWLRTMGYTMEDLSDKTIFEIIHPNCQSKCSGVFSRLSLGTSVEHFESQFLASDGRVIDVEGSASVNLVEGKVQSMQCLLHDITERKRLEETLYRSQQDWEHTFNSITDMVTVHDKDYNIILANKAAERILGLPLLEKMHDRKCFSYYHGTDYAPYGCPSCGCLQSAEPALFEMFEPHLNMFVEIRAIPRLDSSGTLIGLIHIVRDITERKKAESEHERLNQEKEHLREQLLQSQKMEAVGTLAGGIAHDFNNILNVIIGYGGLLETMPAMTGKAKQFLSEITSAANRAAYLTRGLLAFSRKQHLELKPANLNDIIRSITAMLHRIIGEDIRMNIELSQDNMVIICDSGQVEQIVVNLATNARDAMPKGGSLSLKTEIVKMDEQFIALKGFGNPGKYAAMLLTDTGMGMEAETQERIFEPFFTTKAVGKGTGLGLSIIYGIVTQHNGFLECQSSPGQGTTFSVYLPLAVPAESAGEEKEIRNFVAKGRGELILVGEDDESGRRLVKVVLEHQGYRVIEAVNGIEVIEIFKKQSQDIALMLLDVIMPDMSGHDALGLIKEQSPETKVILMSGYTADILSDRGFKDVSVPLLKKPISPHELLRAVRDALDA